jgi:ABC-2 type transport system ATP-binding protein
MGLTVRGLSKSFGSHPALVNVDLDLDPGLIALLGPNGAGKSTLLKCLATSIRPDRGDTSWGGLRYNGNLQTLRSRLGYLPQDLDLPPHLTPLKLLEYMACLKGVHDPAQPRRLLDIFRLNLVARRPFSHLSGGQVRLAGIAQAFLGGPRLLLLDELTRGLDLIERETVFKALRGVGPGCLALFSTHTPADLEAAVSQVVILKDGKVAFSGTVAELRRFARGKVWETRLPSQAADLLDGRRISRVIEAGGEIRARILGEAPSGMDVNAVAPSVEDAYLWLMGERSGLDNHLGNRNVI